MPAFLRVMTSSGSVQLQISSNTTEQHIPTGKRTYSHERSLLSCFGVTVWFSMVMWDDYLWKEIFGELHASGNEKTPIVSSHRHTHTLGSPT